MNAPTYAAPFVLILLLCLGCPGSDSGRAGKEEPPPGTQVALGEEHKDKKFISASMRAWYAWNRQGLDLKKEGKLQEAIYSFQQAVDAWPESLPADEQKEGKQHDPLPTDTLLQLGISYADAGEPQWALHYLDEFERLKGPNPKLTKAARAKAKAALKE